MSEMQQGTWTKPAAMAIPKGGFFKDKVKQGNTAHISQDSRGATASIIAKLVPGARSSSSFLAAQYAGVDFDDFRDAMEGREETKAFFAWLGRGSREDDLLHRRSAIRFAASGITVEQIAPSRPVMSDLRPARVRTNQRNPSQPCTFYWQRSGSVVPGPKEYVVASCRDNLKESHMNRLLIGTAVAVSTWSFPGSCRG